MPEPSVKTIQKIKDRIAKDPILKRILRQSKRKREVKFKEYLKRKKSEFNFLPEEMIKTELVQVEDEEKTTDRRFLCAVAYNLVEWLGEIEEASFFETLDKGNNDFFKLNGEELERVKQIFLKIQKCSWSGYIGSKIQGPLKGSFLEILEGSDERIICRDKTKYEELQKKRKEEMRHLYKENGPHIRLELQEIFFFFEKVFPEETLINNPLLDENCSSCLKRLDGTFFLEKNFTFWGRGRCFEKNQEEFLVIKPHEEKLKEFKLNIKEMVSVFGQLFRNEEIRKVSRKYDEILGDITTKTNLEWSVPNRYASSITSQYLGAIASSKYINRVLEIVREETNEVFPDKDVGEKEGCQVASRTMIEQASISPKSEYYRFKRLINENRTELQNQLQTKILDFESKLTTIDEKIDRILVRTQSEDLFSFFFRLDTRKHKIAGSVLAMIIISILATLYFYGDRLIAWGNKPYAEGMVEEEENNS